MTEIDREKFIRMQEDITHIKEDVKALKEDLRSFLENAPDMFAPRWVADVVKWVGVTGGAILIAYVIKVIFSHQLQ